jgi:hypothetical protein
MRIVYSCKNANKSCPFYRRWRRCTVYLIDAKYRRYRETVSGSTTQAKPVVLRIEKSVLHKNAPRRPSHAHAMTKLFGFRFLVV